MNNNNLNTEKNFDQKLIWQKKKEIDLLIELAITNSPLFLGKFYDSFPNFLKKIQIISKSISFQELRYLAYFKLDFTTKEIAIYTKSTVRAIESRRFRLRKKLNVPKEIDFNFWLISLDDE